MARMKQPRKYTSSFFLARLTVNVAYTLQNVSEKMHALQASETCCFHSTLRSFPKCQRTK